MQLYIVLSVVKNMNNYYPNGLYGYYGQTDKQKDSFKGFVVKCQKKKRKKGKR